MIYLKNRIRWYLTAAIFCSASALHIPFLLLQSMDDKMEADQNITVKK